ncbi:unnamed protein product [Caretta caretta]
MAEGGSRAAQTGSGSPATQAQELAGLCTEQRGHSQPQPDAWRSECFVTSPSRRRGPTETFHLSTPGE